MVSFYGTMVLKIKKELMNKKHRQTLQAIFKIPVPCNIKWADIEVLFVALGGEVSEGRGSRVRVALKGVKAIFHRPHPRKETDRGALVSVRRFLENAGINYDEI